MAKKIRDYVDNAKRRYDESDFGDEDLGISEYMYDDADDDDYGDDGNTDNTDDGDDNEFDSAFDLEAVSEYDENGGFEDPEESDEEESEYEEYHGAGPKESAVQKWSEATTGFMSKMKSELQKSKDKKKPAKQTKPKKSKDKSLDVDFSGSAFDIDEEEEKGLLKKVSGNKKSRSQKEQNRKDILSLLNIPETFVIEEQYYLPDDLKNIEFSYEAPMGFSVKEVERFFNSVVRTVRHYVDLLHKRNEHIVQLAGKIDEKDDVIKKLRYEQEIAQGINVVPTQGDVQLENELTDAKLEINRLKRELKQYANTEPVGLEDEERDKYNELQDQYSLLMREKEELASEVRSQRLQITKLEEDSAPDIHAEMERSEKKNRSRGISAFNEPDSSRENSSSSSSSSIRNVSNVSSDYDDDELNQSLGVKSMISYDDDDDNTKVDAFSRLREDDDDDFLDQMMNEDREEAERSDRGIPKGDNPFL